MGKVTPSLFRNDLVVYVKNLIKCIRKILKKFELSKTAGYKHKTQNSVAFHSPRNEQSGTESIEKFPSSTKNMKYLRIHQTKIYKTYT